MWDFVAMDWHNGSKRRITVFSVFSVRAGLGDKKEAFFFQDF